MTRLEQIKKRLEGYEGDLNTHWEDSEFIHLVRGALAKLNTPIPE